MNIFALIAVGLLGGVLGGMGMGGGTVLIPLLTIFCGVGQISAQAVNLISFIPMAIISLIVHAKNKMLDCKGVFVVILFGVIACVIGCFVAKITDGEVLKKCFGGFLVALSVFQFVSALKSKEK